MSRNGDQPMSEKPNEQSSVAELMKSHDALQAQGLILEVAHALCGISHTLESLQDSLGSTRDQVGRLLKPLDLPPRVQPGPAGTPRRQHARRFQTTERPRRKPGQAQHHPGWEEGILEILHRNLRKCARRTDARAIQDYSMQS